MLNEQVRIKNIKVKLLEVGEDVCDLPPRRDGTKRRLRQKIYKVRIIPTISLDPKEQKHS